MFGEFRLLVQVLDFIWKACQAYADTPQGQKELKDIADAEAAMEPTEPGSSVGTVEGVLNSSLDAARAALKGKAK